MNNNAEQSNADAEHPWLGLTSFTEETQGFFYGREEEVGELARRVQRKLLTVLFGQSGLGKTSILRAGIVPRLRPEGYCPVYIRIDYSPDSPSPTEQIKSAIFAATASTGQWTKSGTAVEGESLWEFLHHRDDILQDANGKTVVPLLIFDQFEEIFTIAQTDDVSRNRAAGFIEDLADLVENRPPKKLEALLEEDETVTERFDFNREDYRILIALREDYLAHLESVKAAMPSITQNRMRLARMTGVQALAAVTKPGGKLVSQEVAESIVRFVAGGSELPNAEVEPSLLSLICRELNNTRIAKGKSEISVDLLAGSHDTILAEFYERALADQPPAVRKVIEDELLTDSGYRENLAEERVLKLFADAGAQPDAKTTLATLVNRRLLRTEDRLDRRRVELTHDVLCGVVKASRAQRLEREAREAAEKNLTTQREREQATRKALNRARQIAGGCAVLAIVAVGAGLMAYRSEMEAAKIRAISESSRTEAEKLVVFILDDFYEEMSPIGRLDVVGGLAKKAVEYYKQLPPEARTPDTQRNSALALARYAQVSTALGNADEATASLNIAKKTLADLEAAGDKSEATQIAFARVAVSEAANLTSRNDQASTIKVVEEALKRITPITVKPEAPLLVKRTEAALRSQLGFAWLRSSVPEKAIEQYRLSRAINASVGALDFANLVATSGYASGGWVLGEALTTVGKPDEAKPILEETIKLAGELEKKRPGHRPALRALSSAYGQLAAIESGALRRASSMQLAREGLRVNEQVTALDPGNTGSQNNLRVAKVQISEAQGELGLIDEALKGFSTALVIDKTERPNGFSMGNLVIWHGWLAVGLAEVGRFEDADASLAKMESYVKSLLATASTKDTRIEMQGALAEGRGRVALLRGDTATVRALEPELAKYIAQIQAFDIELGKDAPTGTDRSLRSLYESTHLALMAQRDYARAAEYARREVQELQKSEQKSVAAQLFIAQARTRMATALAREGKLYDAGKTIEPALAFFKLPDVQQSDSSTIKGDHARALLAAALSTPSAKGAEKQALLREALARFDAMTPQLKAFISNTRLRAEIVGEMGK